MEPVLLGEQRGDVLSPQATRDLGRQICGRLIHRPSLGHGCLQCPLGMPQGSRAFSSGPRAPAHLPEPRWLSGADIHPGNRGRGRSAEQAVGPLSSWAGADPESPGLGITMPRPTGHRPRKAVSPKHQARVQHSRCPRRACCGRLGGGRRGSFRTGQVSTRRERG